MFTFSYNGVSCTTYGIIAKSSSRSILYPIRTRSSVIYGKSGIIDYYNNMHNTITITVHIEFIGSSIANLRSKSHQISEWLISDESKRLIFSDEPDKFYFARLYDEVSIENIITYGKADIVFACQPYCYSVISTSETYSLSASDVTWGDTDLTWLTDYTWAESFNVVNSISFANSGTMRIDHTAPNNAYSTITLTGTWNGLTITNQNGVYLKHDESILSATGTLVIDNIEMTVTLDGVNCLSSMLGDLDTFIPIEVGSNTFHLENFSSDTTVKVDFIPMWK